MAYGTRKWKNTLSHCQFPLKYSHPMLGMEERSPHFCSLTYCLMPMLDTFSWNQFLVTKGLFLSTRQILDSYVMFDLVVFTKQAYLQGPNLLQIYVFCKMNEVTCITSCFFVVSVGSMS
jgi:hypothetical protein